ncbi:MAG: hypothetical protein HC845_01015 [Akkermansiaceae bacterium]|nr:hypothetical protein [Akkermansiaceae bacterium]
MKCNRRITHHRVSAGIGLPLVLFAVAGMLVIAVGVLSLTKIERSTAHTFADYQRAELAARAGLESFRSIILAEAMNDDFLVIQSIPKSPIAEGSYSPPQLFISRGSVVDGKYSYRSIPLFSTSQLPSEMEKLEPPSIEEFAEKPSDMIDFTTVPFYDKVRVSWLPIFNDKGKQIARYAYWVEDLQSRLDPTMVGNQRGEDERHLREPWPSPAPGLNTNEKESKEPMLDQIALYAIESGTTSEQQGNLAEKLLENHELLISPESLWAAAGVNPPLARISDKSKGIPGELVDEKASAVEKALVARISPYKEQALIPFLDGIHPSVAGKPKLNLNELLKIGGDRAVTQMADFIGKALPDFEKRKGGFPDDYLKTLAANAIDYADKDGDSTVKAESYRGIDSFPLVSEFLMQFRWESKFIEDGQQYAEVIVTTYAELWNMTDQVVSGQMQFTHDTKYELHVGNMRRASLADIPSEEPALEKEGEFYWLPAKLITLNPNQYLLVNCGEVKYKLAIGPSSPDISRFTLKGENFGKSGAQYRLKWNGKIVDQTRGGISRRDCELYFPGDENKKPKQQVRATIPAKKSVTRNPKFTPFSADLRENMGDPRMSSYYLSSQEAVGYPVSYSPNSRNILWDIYSEDDNGKSDVRGRTLLSEWPDGGHNSAIGSSTALTQTSIHLAPDDPVFTSSVGSQLHKPPKEESPTRISNRGRFYSATELGRIYDPIMWKVDPPSAANLPWGDVISSSESSSEYGGGNTLRIGRMEHPKFDLENKPGQEAVRLLDLFHVGLSRSEKSIEREGTVVQIQGHVNINTASREAIRAIIIGHRMMDPKMSIRTSENHETSGLMAPPVKPFRLTDEMVNSEADRIADAMIKRRETQPYVSASELAELRDVEGRLIFGNKDLLPNGEKVHWSDSAAEESFARIYEASTVRSRNFRVWVIGQTLEPTSSAGVKPVVLAETRKVYSVFAEPGIRTGDGKIKPENSRLRVLHENNF